MNRTISFEEHHIQVCFYQSIIKEKENEVNNLKYQLKLTEYKLRSFCQIMEELCALEIEIDFNHLNINS